MSFTRDMIQGFLDGFAYAGGSPSDVQKSIAEWMDNHPVYKVEATEKAAILQDIKSYRLPSEQVILG